MKSCTSEQRSHVQFSTYNTVNPKLTLPKNFSEVSDPLSILSPLVRLAPPTVLAPHSILPDFEFPVLLYLVPILRNYLVVGLFFPELGCLECLVFVPRGPLPLYWER